MLPIVLDLARLRLVLVGNGAAARRRLARLDEAGAVDLSVYADAPAAELAAAAGARLVRRLPTPQEIAAARLVFIADPAPLHRADLIATARAAGILVHVEDEPGMSDAHAPAVLRRGELLIAISTGGGSPGLAVRLKRFLGGLFGAEWRQRLDELAALRRGWREAGAEPATVSRRTEAWMERQGWLPEDLAAATGAQLAAARPSASADGRHATAASRH